MKLLDRYIAVTVLQSTMVVMIVLVALVGFATFAGELEKTGKGNYDAVAAMEFTALLLPRLAYQLFPIVVLLGGIVGLGSMAGHSELIVIRAAGVSLKRMIWSVMKVGLLLLTLMLLVGEFVAPKLEFKAQSLRAEAMSSQVSYRNESGLWAKDGETVIHIRDLMAADHVAGISIYDFDKDNQLESITLAKTARFEEDQWHLNGVSKSEFSEQGISKAQEQGMRWHSLLNPELIGVVTVKPDYLSAIGLYKYIDYLQHNGLDAGWHILALWKKAMMPLTTLVMIFLAVPFVFGPLRSVGIGQRIFVGTLFGIGYFLLDQTAGYMGLVYGIPSFLGVLISPVTFLIIAILLLRRVH